MNLLSILSKTKCYFIWITWFIIVNMDEVEGNASVDINIPGIKIEVDAEVRVFKITV